MKTKIPWISVVVVFSFLFLASGYIVKRLSYTQEDMYWKQILTPEQYYILREKGTETPFSGKYAYHTKKGVYTSPGCGKPLFHSKDKYDSGTGWPSFTQPISPHAVRLETDWSLGIPRTEVLDLCGGHLGHVFDDGPAPTGKRYCINSDALVFLPEEEED